MLTAGVDLAAEAKGTALAIVEWQRNRAAVVELHCDVTDDVIVEAAPRVAKLGIDCALGWPLEFVEFLNAYAQPSHNSGEIDGGMTWRRRLAYRETDRHAREMTGRWPLSVATDRLGVTALRAAGLLSRLCKAGVDVDRSGSGRIVEVYPGASLRLWGLSTDGYKRSAEARQNLLDALQKLAPWLQFGDQAKQLVASSDALDAVIAAIAARSVALGMSTEPDDQFRAQAQVEGWIALPTEPLSSLIGAQ